MSEPYIGEIKMFGGNFAPLNYAFCNGQLLNINEYDALYALIGTTYGGGGQTTFALPNLQGRLPVHQGNLSGTNFPLAQLAGTETVTLTSPSQLPPHNHLMNASSGTATSGNPQNNVPASNTNLAIYSPSSVNNSMGNSITPTGGNQPHDNVMPFLCVSFIIALLGIYPPQN